MKTKLMMRIPQNYWLFIQLNKSLIIMVYDVQHLKKHFKCKNDSKVDTDSYKLTSTDNL